MPRLCLTGSNARIFASSMLVKTQISKQHTNAVAVQPQTTFQKEDRMKKQSSTTLKLAMVVAMVITMALSAGAQTVWMMRQDNICGTNPACDTNTMMSFTLPSTIATPVPPGTHQSSAEIRGLAFDNYNNTLYGITAQGGLVTVNKTTGIVSPPILTLSSTTNEWSGLAFNGQNTLYAVNAYGSNELVAIDLPGLTWTVIGHTTFGGTPQQILGLAYSASGVLYGSDRNIDNIVIINPIGGGVSFPYNHTAGINNLQEIGFDPSGILYVVYDHQANSNNAGFAIFNFATGTATEVGTGLNFQIDFNGCPGCGNSTYGAGGFAFVSACLAPPRDMVAWYPLGTPSSATNFQLDLVNNNNATSYGNPKALIIAGKVGAALSFNGTNDYLGASDQTYLNIGANQDLSIDAWVKISSLNPGVVSLVDKRTSSPQGYQFFLYNDRLGLQLANNGTFTNYVSTPAVPADNNWHLVAVTVDRTTSCGTACGTWYLDGTPLVGTFDPSFYTNLTLNSAGIKLLIGAQGTGLGGGEFFNGGLDELEIFNRALNATEVLKLYQAGSAGKCQ